MGSTVVGLYDQKETAHKAHEAIKAAGIDAKDVHMVSHSDTDDKNWKAEDRNWHKGGYGHDLPDNLSDLGVPEDEAMLYAEGVRRGGSLVVARVDDDKAQRLAEIMNTHRPVNLEQRSAGWKKRGYTGYKRTAAPLNREDVAKEREHAEKEETLQVGEEEIKVGKREVSRGGVRVHTRVREVPVEERVSLRDEFVNVERRNVDRAAKAGDRLFEERTIEMRETDEEAVVSKSTHVTGEVVVKKGAETHTDTVSDKVRKTEVEVEQLEGDANLKRGYDTHRSAFQSHWQTKYGKDWDKYEPAYRWGYTSGSNDTYRDRDYNTAERDLRRDYETRHGEGTFDQVKDAIRMAYDKARARV